MLISQLHRKVPSEFAGMGNVLTSSFCGQFKYIPSRNTWTLLVEFASTPLSVAPLEFELWPDTRDYVGPGFRFATMHGVKGLEFAHMLIVGVCDGVILASHALLGSDDEIQERCLLHVAASRGRDAQTITSHGWPSKFIQEPK